MNMNIFALVLAGVFGAVVHILLAAVFVIPYYATAPVYGADSDAFRLISAGLVLCSFVVDSIVAVRYVSLYSRSSALTTMGGAVGGAFSGELGRVLQFAFWLLAGPLVVLIGFARLGHGSIWDSRPSELWDTGLALVISVYVCMIVSFGTSLAFFVTMPIGAISGAIWARKIRRGPKGAAPLPNRSAL